MVDTWLPLNNVDASQNTIESALYPTNPSLNWVAYLKMNSEHFSFLSIFWCNVTLIYQNIQASLNFKIPGFSFIYSAYFFFFIIVTFSIVTLM